MRHTLMRVILGIILCVVGIVVLVRGRIDRYFAALFLIVGLIYLYSAYRMTRKK